MDIRTLSRATGAFCLIVGPISVALGSLFQQVHDGDSTSTALRRIAAHPGAAHAAIVFDVGAIAMIPATLFLMQLARDRAPRLAIIGGAIAFIGWTVGVASFVGTDVLQYHAAQATDHAAALALVDKVNHDPILGSLVGVFVVGHLLGMLLLGIGLWRARAVATWAAFLSTSCHPGDCPITRSGPEPAATSASLGWTVRSTRRRVSASGNGHGVARDSS